jgi:iron(III) transport system permease protein
MISVILLERPGWWRIAWVAALLLLGVLPVVPLVWGTVTSDAFAGLRGAFASALGNSLGVGILVAPLSLLVGLPLGAAAGLYSFPARRALLAALALPMLVPSFLWAVGWSALAARA